MSAHTEFQNHPNRSPLAAAQFFQKEAQRLIEDGGCGEAIGLCRKAIGSLSEMHEEASPRAAFVLFSTGVILERAGAYAEAEECAVRALSMIGLLPMAKGVTMDLLRLRALLLLAASLRQSGEYAKALPPVERAIEIAETMPDRPGEAANAWNSLGMICKYAGWFERGEGAYARALESAARVDRHREEITATILHNMGGIRHARGRFDLAEEPARRAWEIRRELLGDDHAATLADATAWAAVLDGLGRWAESRPIYEHALRIYGKMFGPEHYEIAATLHNLALVEDATGNRERALEFAHRAWQIKTGLLGTGHPDTALSAMNLASLMIQENPAEARELLANFAVHFHSPAFGGFGCFRGRESLMRSGSCSSSSSRPTASCVALARSEIRSTSPRANRTAA